MSSSTVSASTASAIPSLCIGYALDRCTVEQVAEIFNYIIDDNQVDNVKMLDKTNNATGRPFKIFFINFKRTSDKLSGVVERIEEEGFIKVEYDAPWFWKVTLAKKKEEAPAEKKGPRIMGRDE
jgi:hypothetical protein